MTPLPGWWVIEQPRQGETWLAMAVLTIAWAKSDAVIATVSVVPQEARHCDLCQTTHWVLQANQELMETVR